MALDRTVLTKEQKNARNRAKRKRQRANGVDHNHLRAERREYLRARQLRGLDRLTAIAQQIGYT